MNDRMTLKEFFEKAERIQDEVREETKRCKKYTEERKRRKEEKLKQNVKE